MSECNRLGTSVDVRQTLADLTTIAQQEPPNGVAVFNAMHTSLDQRSIYRAGMQSSLLVPASVLETLARQGHIDWVSRGMGIDTFVLVSSRPNGTHT